jgi:glycosyltransferase involved in cell wall biosynthesis
VQINFLKQKVLPPQNMPMGRRANRSRPLIALFDYPDVFEDFYPRYGVDQKHFVTRWAATGTHAMALLLQQEIGDVLWYEYSLDPQVRESRHQVTGCQVKFLPSSWLHRQLWRIFYTPKNAWRWHDAAYPAYAFLASYVALLSIPFFKALWRDRPDVIFTQDYATGKFDMLLLLARLLGIPLLAYHAGSRPEHYIGRFAKRWTIARADCLLVSSQEELQMLADCYGVPRQRMRVVLTPIDTNAFRPLDRDAACAAAGLDPARRYLLFVGRLDDRIKRVSTLIRNFAKAAQHYPDFRLLIVGDGADRAKLQGLASDTAAGKIDFLGWVSGAAALAPLYNAADCLVLPSLSEGFPTVVGEAMACGTPVLASRVGGVAELVKEGRTGWLISPGDDQALCAALGSVMSAPNIVASMRSNARLMAETRVSPLVVGAALKKCFTAVSESHGSKDS